MSCQSGCPLYPYALLKLKWVPFYVYVMSMVFEFQAFDVKLSEEKQVQVFFIDIEALHRMSYGSVHQSGRK